MESSIEYNNETGLFEVVSPSEDDPNENETTQEYVDGSTVDTSDSEQIGGESQDVIQNSFTVDSEGNLISDQTEGQDFDEENETSGISADGISLYSTVDSSLSYTPVAWQVNIASNRELGQHYLMWAVREYFSGSGYNNYYWRYCLVIGDDIFVNGDTYTYSDCEYYEQYSYNSQNNYSVTVDSGSVSGSSYLVYSDLYFDYVGTSDKVDSSLVVYAMLVIIIALLVLILKRK